MKGHRITKAGRKFDTVATKLLGKVIKSLGRYGINGFTLAEMMVVLLIMTVILAAGAPLMTTRHQRDTSQPWRWLSEGSPHAYFGNLPSQVGMIGQNDFGVQSDQEQRAKLIINSTLDDHILFKNNNDILGRIRLNDNGILLGNTGEDSTLTNSVIIGNNTSNSSSNVIAIGNSTQIADSSNNAIAIGDSAEIAENSNGSIAIGNSSRANDGSFSAGAQAYSFENSIAIGSKTLAGIIPAYFFQGIHWERTKSYAIAVGPSSDDILTLAYGDGAIAMGKDSQAIGDNAISFGNTLKIGNKSIGIGANIDSDYTNEYNYGNILIGRDIKLVGKNTRDNIGVGYKALNDTYEESQNNIAIGNEALSRSKIHILNNIAIGKGALASLRRYSSGNIAIGNNALKSLTEDGSFWFGSNIALGNDSCANVKGGSNKVCIGNSSGPAEGSSDANNRDPQIYLGTNTTTVIIPGKLNVTGEIRGPIVNTSDRRLKNVGKEFTSGLDKIRELKVFSFKYKDDKTKTPRVGVIAQDLQKVFPDAVKKDSKGYLSIRMEDMFYAVINAIKELDIRFNALKRENEQLKQKCADLEKRLEALERKVK